MEKRDCGVDAGNKKERKSADGIDEEFDAEVNDGGMKRERNAEFKAEDKLCGI